MTMGEAISAVAGARPGPGSARVCGQERLTNRQVLERIDSLARGLAGLGVRKGEKVAALMPPGADLAALFFAVAKRGAVIVPLSPELRERALNDILEDAQPLAVVSEGSTPGMPVSALMKDQAPDPAPSADVAPGDLLALLYTSGTTGRPKATMHSHASLIAPVVATLRIREQWARPSQPRDDRGSGESGGPLPRPSHPLAVRPQTIMSTWRARAHSRAST